MATTKLYRIKTDLVKLRSTWASMHMGRVEGVSQELKAELKAAPWAGPSPLPAVLGKERNRKHLCLNEERGRVDLRGLWSPHYELVTLSPVNPPYSLPAPNHYTPS